MRFRIAIGAIGMAWLLSCLLVRGQDARRDLLMHQAPFDVLTLDKTNDNKVYKVYPVALPGRRVPDKPRPSDKLRVKLIETDEEYEVAWFNVAKLELYEQMVLGEANKLAAEGRLDDAYQVFAFLLEYYPQTPGLAEGRQNYLYLASGAAYRQQKYDEALAILEELYALNPDFRPGENAPPLIERLGVVADRLISASVERGEFRAARSLIERLGRQYKADGEAFLKKWRDQLTALAAAKRDAAKADLEAGRFIEAHDAMAAMHMIWPEVSGGAEVAAEVARRHPLIRVGVQHPALAFDGNSLHDVAARRAGRLTQRLLVECVGLGIEGGKYTSPLIQFERSADGLSLSLQLPTSTETSVVIDLVQRLVARATPGSAEYHPAWRQVVSTVGLASTSEVRVALNRPHVLAEDLLRIPLFPSGSPQAAGGQPYSVLSHEGDDKRFVASGDYAFARPGQPAEIVERYIADPQRAMRALKQGELDVLDRVFPGDIASLRADDSLVVAPYGGPTTHVLAVRSRHPYLLNPAFRRALVYGANRELLLSQGLLRGTTLPGYRVVSAPFPAPSPGLELPAYGYDPQIEPRPYDPRLAMGLVLVAQGELKGAYEKQQQQAPALAPLVLGHPADETSRIACRGLVRDWKRIGVECKLVEFSPGVFDDADGKCDLVYLQLGTWEPLVDAARLLGPGGLAEADNPAIQLVLRQLAASTNWQQVRERMVALHRLVHEDATVLPLWQTIDHYAYRRALGGLSDGRLTLYQDVEQWRSVAQLARSEP
jgi:tetratricopeptide (TPR) repeat protein